MTAAFLVTLRETLEASLLIGVVLGQLYQTNNHHYIKYVWLGTALGVVNSLLFAYIFHSIAYTFTGSSQYAYEGICMILGACFVTWMMWWLHRNSQAQQASVQRKTNEYIASSYPIGIASLVFLAVAREGIETVIFLQATFFVAQDVWHSAGAIFGILLAIVLSYGLFKSIISLSLRTFFRTVHAMLLFVAAGLVAHGVHELQEGGFLPILREHIWDTNAWLPETSLLGQMAKAVFGYNGNPSLLEASSYVLYIACVTVVWRWYTVRTVPPTL